LKCCGMSAATSEQYFEGDCSRMAISEPPRFAVLNLTRPYWGSGPRVTVLRTRYYLLSGAR
jgi:hypothetical protein